MFISVSAATGTRHKFRPSHPHNEEHLRFQMRRPCQPVFRLHALQPRRRTPRAIWNPPYCTPLSIRTRFYVEGSSPIEHLRRLVTACSMDGPCWRTSVRTPSVTECPSFAHRNQGVVKIRERLAVSSLFAWDNKITTVTQECVICGSVYVDGQNMGELGHSITQPRANLTEGHAEITTNNAEKDKDVQTFDLPNPVELKGNTTIPPAAIHLPVCSGTVCSSKQLKLYTERGAQLSTPNSRQLAVSTCIRHSSHSPLIYLQSSRFAISTPVHASTGYST